MNRDALWRILGLRGVPPKLINLISELYSGIESAVRCGDTISDLFPVVTGVRQGCVLAATLQCLYERGCRSDSGEDVRVIKLWCVVWEGQDL